MNEKGWWVSQVDPCCAGMALSWECIQRSMGYQGAKLGRDGGCYSEKGEGWLRWGLRATVNWDAPF